MLSAPIKIQILGVPLSITNMTTTINFAMKSLRSQADFVLVRDVASLMLAVNDPTLLKIHRDALLVVPDGTPLVWVGRMLGYGSQIGRVAGADLVDAVCERSLETGQSHYFYGGKPGVAAEMALRLRERYPGLKVVGVFSPPMRDIDANFTIDDETSQEISEIRESGADFIWVGISSPKQEFFMNVAAPAVGRGILLGVGAAFDFHSGARARAPLWMRNNGLEWLHRLLCEPRRLWRRYLILAPLFLIRIVPQVLRIRLALRRE